MFNGEVSCESMKSVSLRKEDAMSLQKLYLNMLEEGESEVEETLLILQYLNYQRKHRFWITNHIKCHSHSKYAKLFQEFDDESFQKYYRVRRNNFYELHDIIKPYIQKQDPNYRRAVGTEEKLAVCLKLVKQFLINYVFIIIEQRNIKLTFQRHINYFNLIW